MITVLITISAYLLLSALNLFTAIFYRFDKPRTRLDDNELPTVAVLVAARNEENNIALCLQHLTRLNYPKNKLTILVGNDQSEDNTGNIVADFENKNKQIKQIHITRQLGKAKGKANVLAQLAHHTDAEYIFITDADIEVNPNWVRNTLQFFTPETGIVSGTTIVKNQGFLKPMQQTDWLYFMGLLLTFERCNIHSTAVGNNMAIRRTAYLSTGGYENFDFSVTEDYKLFQQARKQGWKTVNMIHPESVNQSAAAPDFKTLLNQRKRWLKGAKELPFYWWLIFGLFGSFFPLIICIAFLNFKLALIIYLVKFIIQSATILFQQLMNKINVSFIHLFTYEIYTIAITLLTAFYSIIPVKLNWKNRYY